MKASKLREMTIEELKAEELRMIDQIFRLRFQIAASQAENPARVHLLRKDLARVKTLLREKKGPVARVSSSQQPAAPVSKGETPGAAGGREARKRVTNA